MSGLALGLGLGLAPFRRVSGGPPPPSPTWDADVITNGGFNNGASWTLGNTNPPTISAGALRGDVAGSGDAQQDLSVLANGVAYALDIVISSMTTGSVNIQLSGSPMLVSGGNFNATAPGTYSCYGVKTSGGNLLLINLVTTDAVIESIVMRHPTTLMEEENPDPGFNSPGSWTVNINGAVSGGVYSATATVGNRTCNITPSPNN